MMPVSVKNAKVSGKMRSMTIDMLDDGSYMMAMHNDKDMSSKRKSFRNVKDLMAGMMDEIGEKGMKSGMKSKDKLGEKDGDE